MRPPEDIPTLKELGISKDQSSRWQLEAQKKPGANPRPFPQQELIY